MHPMATILIVEDEQLVARDLKNLLEVMGFHVPAIFSCSDEVLQFIENIVPDLILMDIKLEGELDGIDTAEQIKKHIDVPIVFLTAYPEEQYFDRAKHVNPAGYLLKPFEERELEITISLALYKYEVDKKLRIRESQYQQLFESIPIGIYHASAEGKFLDVNQTLISMLEYTDKKDLLKQRVEKRYFNPKGKSAWLNSIQEKETLKGVETQWKTKNDNSIWVLESVKAIRDDKGKIICFEGAVQDISEKKKAETVLLNTKNALEDYITEMKEYARIASHDLLEPLRQVSSYAQLLEKRFYGKLDSEADEFISYITEGTERMHSLIQDFVDYTNVLTKSPQKFDISSEAIIESVISHLNPELLSIKATITYDPLPVISGDPNMIQLLFEHLIDNAIKYRSESPPTIHIFAEKQSDGFLFTLQDNGIGIPFAYQNQIFKLFTRLHSKQNYPGTGLGLAICKQIVKKHGGKIWVESKETGGAAFSFTIKNDQLAPDRMNINK